MSDEIELLDPEPATLTVEARAAVALKSSDTELHLIALAAKNAGIVAIIDKAGREQAHGAAMELKTTRVAIEKTSKTARDDATKFSRAVIEEEKRLVAIIQPEETRLLGLRDDWDAAQAAIKVEAERLAQEAAAQAEADSKALADYHAAITTPVEAVPVAEPEAPPVSTELFDGVMELSGQLMSIAMEPTPPNAEALIGVIATHFKVSDELAAEWLDSADFTPYY